MLRNLSIVAFLGLAACGGSKSEAKGPANHDNATSAAPGDAASADDCCCMTEMHSCSVMTSAACEQASGQCGGDTASCDCDDGEGP